MAKINWNSKAMRKIKSHQAVDEAEDRDMDEGRFFVHLKNGWDWNIEREVRQTQSFGGATEALKALTKIKEVPPATSLGKGE